MKALKTEDNILILEASRIEFGTWDEPDVQKWALFDENGNVQMYAIDSNFTVVDFNPADKPDDYVEGKYFYINGKFVLNPDWVEPPMPLEEQVAYLVGTNAQLAADLDFIAMELGVDLYE